MDTASLFRLILLGAIWGVSFSLQRITVPVFGPAWVTEIRLGIAALFLVLIALITRRALNAGQNWRHYLIVGLLNSALPFFLFAYAAARVPASLLAIFNSLAPIFGAIVSYMWLRTKVSGGGLAGLLIGLIGVGIITSGTLADVAIDDKASVALGLAAALTASLCYGIAATYIKSRANQVEPFQNACGSMIAASLWVLPLAVPAQIPASVSADTVIALIVLGLVCTGAAYLLSFRLIADLGPMKAMTVTYLVPVFGVLWGVIFLNEPITIALLIGGALVILGTGLATGYISMPFNRDETRP